MTYQSHITDTHTLIRKHNGTWDGIDAEAVARMRYRTASRPGSTSRAIPAKIMRARHGGL